MESADYQQTLAVMHRNDAWGASSAIPELAIETIEKLGVRSLLDFGSGKGRVSEALRQRFPELLVHSYEPSTPGSVLPDNVDLTFSKDVLEHVEPGRLDATLYELHKRTNKAHYHLIACHRAHHYLPDGRNAHLIVETPDWWQRRLRSLGYRIVEERIWGEIKRPAGKESIAVCKYECVLVGSSAG